MPRLTAALAAFALLIGLSATGTPPASAAQAGAIQGVVTVPAGLSPSHTLVELYGTQRNQFAQVFASSTGQYSFPALADGTYIVLFRAAVTADRLLSEFAGGSYRWDTAQQIVVAGGGIVHVDATLERGAVLTLAASDPSGALASDVAVTLRRVDDPDPFVWADPAGVAWSGTGTFTTSILTPGVYEITLGGQRWVTRKLELIVGTGTDSSSTVVLSPGATRTVDVALEVKGRVRGSVTVETPGGIIPWVNGTVSIVDPTGLTQHAYGFTSQDGSFDIIGADDGSYKVLLESSTYTQSTYWPGTTDPAAAQTITISRGTVQDLGPTSIQQGGRLLGRVLASNPGVAPTPATATVELWKVDETDGSYTFYGDEVTDWTGGFWPGVIEAGSYALRARPTEPDSLLGAEWYPDARYFQDRIDVEVVAGTTTSVQDIVLDDRYFDVSRIAGANRFETAVEISRQVIPPGERAPIVYLTNAFNFPDALSAGPAAIRAGGVILSTDPLNLPTVIGNRLAELDPVRVVILGDEKSVSQAVEQAVRTRLPAAEIDRLGGASRYATGELVVRDAFEGTGAQQAVIATGANYPDALAAGPAAGFDDSPVILVDGKNGLNQTSLTLMRDLGVTDVVIAGGLPSVGSQVEAGLVAELGAAHVTRLAGANRYETAVLINDHFFADTDYAYLTTGQNFADALTGGPLAGLFGAPLYLSAPDCLPGGVADSLWYKNVVAIDLFGSSASLSTDVEDLWVC
ncbi:cell wall-binding repeat-containing protein [Microbacterium sp. BK668]|uniref:cell wall-binding repeat-containing protein n=1 Tax=Microbacterium sp. BK668 TaxID=2512118 RepID=UPI00105B9BD6|nr:cell wall-binding repeat-containing protein [Microbacterium sp. BK668]TDN91156.1 putative cell wall binding repeat protein [Microbacterium sp. BK668]